MNLTPKGYIPRLVDERLKFMLGAYGAVCVEGPKWCGKTWTSLNQATSVVSIGDPFGNFQNRTLAEIDPSQILVGGRPRLIDEWQEVPSLWDAVRSEVDKTAEKGQFILTGSSTPARKGVLHSGIGRFGMVRMHTMSLFESGDSNGTVSLKSIMENKPVSSKGKEITLMSIAEMLIRGGWPDTIGADIDVASEIPRGYLELLAREDMQRVGGARYNQEKIWMLLRSLARNESTLAGKTTILRDIMDNEGDSIDVNTVTRYLSVLDRLFVTEDQPAFSPYLRSSVRVGKSVKRHFTDPSLAVAALGATPKTLMGDLETLGFLFESLCERDLRIYAETFGGTLHHYNDSSGMEIDAVVQCPDGRWCAFEIKLGHNRVDEAAEKLLSFKSKIMEENPKKAPSSLCVICGLSDFAYTRDDGVMVVPITALRN